MADRTERIAYCRVVVGKRVINTHVLKEPLDVHFEEPFNLQVIEFRINKYRTNVSFDHVR